ncbi:uncharacterized protein LOC9305353, partial [Arabidopsis lyrata subsp. lyrata]|uniref:uncharacterized protein LOC9305353 n=1 Tax=Arabidopsis lyrata subsp. lyrata TaxID=81972 RepID=UPI000A29E87F
LPFHLYDIYKLAKKKTQFSEKRCCSFFQFLAAYFRALPFWLMESLRSKCKNLIISINCFGCCNRERPLVVEVDEPSKGLKIQGRVVKKDGGSSDGLWSTSTCDMDHNITIRSQSSNPLFDPQCSTSNSTEFVNHGNYLNVLRPS